MQDENPGPQNDEDDRFLVECFSEANNQFQWNANILQSEEKYVAGRD